jgi:hypothetical protein
MIGQDRRGFFAPLSYQHPTTKNPRELFKALLPQFTRGVDEIGSAMPFRPRDKAAECLYVQPNPSKLVRWLVFDVDYLDAYTAAERAGVAEPDIIVMNPDNHRGHLYYLLSAPVSRSRRSRRYPVALMNKTVRKMTLALQADSSYIGLIAKNPLHPQWRVRWGSCRGYSLTQLLESIPEKSEQPDTEEKVNVPQVALGESRNCAIFDAARVRAYRVFGKCRSASDFTNRVVEDCHSMNDALPSPLDHREVSVIARSISDWVVENFAKGRRRNASVELRERQTFLANWRWFKERERAVGGKVLTVDRMRQSRVIYPDKALSHATLRGWQERLKPWNHQGISRATYYRRKRKLLSEGSRPRAIRRQRIEVRPKINRTPSVPVTLESIYTLYRDDSAVRIQPNTA